MANLIIQENGMPRTKSAVHGEELTIQAPCNCSDVNGVQIAGVAYPFYDAAGNSIVNITGKFSTGSLIRVLIDTVNVRAYILNSATVTPKAHNHAASEITAGTFSGQVVANNAGQSPGTYLVRNSKLSATEETPTINGAICWLYE
jgi:hypothetical protein